MNRLLLYIIYAIKALFACKTAPVFAAAIIVRVPEKTVPIRRRFPAFTQYRKMTCLPGHLLPFQIENGSIYRIGSGV